MAGALLEIDATDDELVAAVREGDADAFRQLVDRHRDWLTARCRRHLGGDLHAAEDLAQECLLALQRTIVTKDAPLRVRPWLTVVARNRCIDESRKRKAVPTAAVPDGVVFDPEVGDGDETLVRAWGALNGRHRRVLELRELSGLSYEEIAASLALTSGAVEALLFRARSALRREYARAGGKVAAMAPMQEAVARASGHRGVLGALADGGYALVDGASGAVAGAPDVIAGSGLGAPSTAATSSTDSGLRLLHELQVRLLGLPGVDGVLGGSVGGGRLRAALAAAAMLLGGASVVAGSVIATPDATAPAVTTPPAVVVVPEAPAATTPVPPPTPSASTTPTAPTTPTTPTAPTTPATPAPPSPSADPPAATVPVPVPTTLLPEGLLPSPVTVPPVTLPPLVDDTVDSVEALLGHLLTSPR